MNLSRGRFGASLASSAIVGTGLPILGATPAFATPVRPLGTIGMIKPSITQGPIEELIPFLPRGLAYVPTYLDFATGSKTEFAAAMPVYERCLELLRAQKCDVIAAEGAPPFMIQGPKREAEILDAWQKKYGIPIFTSSQNQVRALRALGVKRIVGATYLSDDLNALFAKYFTDVGFTVLSMNGFKAPFETIQDIPSAQIADYIRKQVAANPSADVVYMLGSGWRTLDILAPLEKELGIPVLHPVIARAWEIQKRLNIHVPMQGYGRLMAELPS